MVSWKEYYAGLGGYFRREDAEEWKEWDHGVERFYVYILEIDRPPGRYVGQTKNPRRRLRAHADGAVKTTAGAAVEVVYVVEVATREEAVRYEWFLKRMHAECPEMVGRFIGQVGKETRRVLARSGVPKGLRRWKRDGSEEGIEDPVASGRRWGRSGRAVRWMMAGFVGLSVIWLFAADLFEEGRRGNEAESEPVVLETVETQDDREPEGVPVEDSAVTRRLGQTEEEAGGLGGGRRAGDLALQGGGIDGGNERSGGVAPSVQAGPARVGGEVREATRTTYVEPVYPEIAKRAGVSGAVILEAVIDPDGNVTDVNVLRSIPLLDEAAMDAVRQWKYQPTLLNGVPVPVVMTVTVNFGRT